MSVVLDVRGLGVVFGGASSVSSGAGLVDVTFTVDGGACLAVLGKSGSGKSSLLRTLAGLQAERAGRVLVRDREITSLPAEQRGVVYLHQEPVLFPHLSVSENVAFPMRIRGVDAGRAARQAEAWLERLQIADVSRARPRALSGGQRHRVALARALSAEPSVLLLDEPLSSLDPEVRRDVRSALQEVRAASGAAMVLVTHDLDDALVIASSMAVIDSRGTLSDPLSPGQMLDHPPSADAARLLGVFSAIDGDARLDDTRFHWRGGSVSCAGVKAGRATAFVRAHEVRIAREPQHGAVPLRVTQRQDAAHDVMLTLADADGGQLLLRVPSATEVRVDDTVSVTLTHARFYPAE